MTVRKRRALFYGLVALFLVVGTGIVLYAQGWRFDFATFTTEKVGAIFVNSAPVNAAITLNNKKIKNESNFLNRGTLISNLFPRSYTLTLTEKGYDPWKEQVAVSPTLVTEMKYAVLVPANASSVSPTAGVTDFFETSGGDVVTESANDIIATPRHTATSSAATSSIVIAHGEIITHSTDFTTLVVKKAAGTYFAYDPSTPSSTPINLSALFARAGIAPKTITAITVDPYNATNVFIETPQKFFTIDLSQRTIAALTSAPAHTTLETPFAISSSWLAWAEYHAASSTSQIVIYDPFSKGIINKSLTIKGKVASLKWIRGTTLGILRTDGTLSRYEIPTQTLTSIASGIKSFYPTSDGSTIAALGNKGLEIFSLTLSSSEGNYYRFNLPNITEIRSLIWYQDNTHLFVVYPDHVNFLDLADLSLKNFTDISPIAPHTMPIYDTTQDALYLINEQKRLVRFTFPGL